MNKIDTYLQELYIQEEIDIFMEGILDNFPKFDYKNIAKKMVSVFDPSNLKKSIVKLSTIVPPGVTINNFQKLESKVSEHIENYQTLKETATPIIKNSLPGISPKMLNLASSFLAISSFVSDKKNDKITAEKNLRNQIKKFVYKARGFADEQEEDERMKMKPSDYTDMVIGFTIIVLSTYIVGKLVSGGTAAIQFVIALSTAWWFVPVVIIFALFLAFVVISMIMQNRAFNISLED